MLRPGSDLVAAINLTMGSVSTKKQGTEVVRRKLQSAKGFLSAFARMELCFMSQTAKFATRQVSCFFAHMARCSEAKPWHPCRDVLETMPLYVYIKAQDKSSLWVQRSLDGV